VVARDEQAGRDDLVVRLARRFAKVEAGVRRDLDAHLGKPERLMRVVADSVEYDHVGRALLDLENIHACLGDAQALGDKAREREPARLLIPRPVVV